METAQATTEEALYANVNTTRYPIASVTSYPTDTTTTPNSYVAQTKAATGYYAIGPSIVLRVMAGDKFNLKVSSWYKRNGTTPGTASNPFKELVTGLLPVLAGVSSGPGMGAHGATETQLDGSNISSEITDFINAQNSPPGRVDANIPKAFVNWVLFDEQFTLVSSSSGFEQVGGDQVFTKHIKNNLPVTANGYLYIYVSNATPNIPVYFDNLQVTHVRGPLLQEDHYYPHGLTMAGIRSKAATTAVTNVYKANCSSQLGQQEWADGSGLELYETPARSYDAQIGRFAQADPIGWKTPNVSEYAFVYNDPISIIDPKGLEGEPTTSTFDHNWIGGLRVKSVFANDGSGGFGYYQLDQNGAFDRSTFSLYGIRLDEVQEYAERTYSQPGRDNIRAYYGHNRNKGMFDITWFVSFGPGDGDYMAEDIRLTTEYLVGIINQQRDFDRDVRDYVDKLHGQIESAIGAFDVVALKTIEKGIEAGGKYRSVFSDAKFFVKAGSSLRIISRGVAFLNVIIAADDYTKSNGSLHSTLDLGFGTVALFFPEVGVVYAIVDLGSRAFTTNSISETIEDLKREVAQSRYDQFIEDLGK